VSKPAAAWKRPLLIVLATAPIGLAIFSFVFMARSELAFDETTCPYRDGSVRPIEPGIDVREDSRTCENEVEERRWVLMRQGKAPMEIGRRRLPSQYFRGAYAWSATLHDGHVVLEIRNPGMEPRVFLEPVPDAGSPAGYPRRD
jgi:hypothetical protein